MNKIFVLIISLFLVFNLAFATDTTNVAVSWVEGDTYILYYGAVTFPAAAGTDNAFTQAMDISDCVVKQGELFGGIQVKFVDGTGTEDADGFIEYSNSLTAADFLSVTDADLNQIQVTTKFDTVGVATAAMDYFQFSRYIRLKLDGQTGNPNGAVCNFYLKVYKREGAPKKGCAGAKDTS